MSEVKISCNGEMLLGVVESLIFLWRSSLILALGLKSRIDIMTGVKSLLQTLQPERFSTLCHLTHM